MTKADWELHLSPAETWKRMEAAHAVEFEAVCVTCGGKAINGRCDQCRRLTCDA